MNKILPILFFTLLITASYCTHAQQYGIAKAQAFFRKSIAGNIPVDGEGRPMSSGVRQDYLIYIETKGSSLPQWQTAYIDGMPYTARAVEVKQTPLSLGKLKASNAPVSIKKNTGNRLWQLVLTPTQNTQTEASPASNATPTAALSGNWRGKSFTYKITKMQELAKQFNP